MASTYPLELVQASQWLQRNPGFTGAALTQAAEQQNWDPSIQALVVFPDLVKRLNQDITWTTNLGNAFLSQQGDVMDAVQRMRLKAQQAGKLSSTSQQTVSTTNDSGQAVIVIQPANPQMMYVPYYDPAFIWGPPLYYPYASWYYPPWLLRLWRRHHRWVCILAADGVAGADGVGGPAGAATTSIVNNSFIHRYNFNSRGSASLSGRSAWAHDASHRGGVPYSNAALTSRYRGNVRQNLQTRGSAGQTQSPRRTPNPEASEWAIGRLRRAHASRTAALSAAFGRAVRRGRIATMDTPAWGLRGAAAEASRAEEAGAAACVAAAVVDIDRSESCGKPI